MGGGLSVMLVDRMMDSNDCLKSSGGAEGVGGLIDDRRRLLYHQYTAALIDPNVRTIAVVLALGGMD